jgi:hypothetical protein
LLEALFEFHFELLEELPYTSLVVYIDKDSNKFIAVFLLKISPRAWIVWLSTEIDPNSARSSRSVAPINSSGIGCPSLNFRGSRIS